MKRSRPGPVREGVSTPPHKPRAVEGSGSTIAKGALSRYPLQSPSAFLTITPAPPTWGRDPTTHRHALSWRHRDA